MTGWHFDRDDQRVRTSAALRDAHKARDETYEPPKLPVQAEGRCWLVRHMPTSTSKEPSK